MRVLGIDPGYARCGWGVVDFSGDVQHVAHGCFETSSHVSVHERLRIIGDECARVIRLYAPSHMALETVYFKQSTTTALGVAQARGVLFYVAAVCGLEVDEISPANVKMSLTGYGKADKRQMQQMVKIQLKLADVPQPDDAADALAVAITSALCFRALHR